MLKYAYTKELFTEVPGEITLGISITGCTIHCKGCHSRELWEDKGESLDVETLCGLLNQHEGITCLLLLGGEHDIDALTELFMYAHKRIKTAWYCGLDMIPNDKKGILRYLDWVKLGHFDVELGGLDSPITNQRFYKLYQDEGGVIMADETNLFQKNNGLQQTIQTEELDKMP